MGVLVPYGYSFPDGCGIDEHFACANNDYRLAPSELFIESSYPDSQGSYDAEKLAKILTDSNLNFKYSTIEKATGNWDESNKLGQGGFGTVYKGVLSDGREIAVKRLFVNNKFRAADFYNEVNMISGVENKNLVRLLGCSCSGPESILVYEYLPNMSLNLFLFGTLQILTRIAAWENLQNAKCKSRGVNPKT